MPHSIVWNIVLRELKLYPHKLQVSTALTEQHGRSRLCFAIQYQKKQRYYSGYLKRIIFSDECKFSLSGKVVKQNCLIYGTECPNQVYETLKNSMSVKIWCALSKNTVIDHFLERKRLGQHVQKNALLFHVSQAPRLPRKHDVPGVRCSSALFP